MTKARKDVSTKRTRARNDERTRARMVYVRKLTEVDHEAMARVQHFLAARTRADSDGKTRTTLLYRSLDRWLTVTGRPQMSMSQFVNAMTDLGYERSIGRQYDSFHGLSLLGPLEAVPDVAELKRQVPGDKNVG